MIEIDGKTVFTELQEVVDPTHTALLVVDMQGEPRNTPTWTEVEGRIREVLDTAREAGVYVVHTYNEQLGYSTVSAPYLRLMMKSGHRPGIDPVPDMAGTPKTQFVPSLQPSCREPVIAKRRGSAFAGTDLDMILRAKQITSVVVTGCSTDQCVYSTMWDTHSLDYYAVLLEDCVHSPRPEAAEAAIKQLRLVADVEQSEPVLHIWRGKVGKRLG